MQRRQFLSTAATLAGGLTLASLSRNAFAAGKYDSLHLGIQLYSLRGYPVEQALIYAKELGFSHVEFYSGMFAADSTQQQIDAMLKRVADIGLKISGYGVMPFTNNHEANEKTFKFAKAAEIRTLMASPTPDSFESLNRLVKEYDIRIAIHNHGPTDRYAKAIDVLSAVEKQDPRIGACADLGHYIRSGQKPTEVIRILKGRLFGIHLKDFAEMQDKTQGVILGKGHLNCAEVFDALVNAGFPEDGALSLEYEENESNPLEDIKKCKAVAQAAMIS